MNAWGESVGGTVILGVAIMLTVAVGITIFVSLGFVAKAITKKDNFITRGS